MVEKIEVVDSEDFSDLNSLLLPLGQYLSSDPYNSASQLFSLWCLFNGWLSISNSDFVNKNIHNVEEIYDTMIRNNLCETFFTAALFTNLSVGDVPSLAHFLESFIAYIFSLKTFQLPHLTSLSNLLLLSWWSKCFQRPTIYCLLARQLRISISRSLSVLIIDGKSNLWDMLRYHPELANVFVTELLRIFSHCELTETNSSTYTKTSGVPDEDAVSRTVGLYGSNCLCILGDIYRSSLAALRTTNHLAIPSKNITAANLLRTPALSSSCGSDAQLDRDTVVALLSVVIKWDLTKTLYQQPGLPLPDTLFGLPSGFAGQRYLTVRSYYQLRASRLLAAALKQNRIPCEFSRLVRACACKHLVNSLLLPAGESQHTELIGWSLDRELCVREYAFWLVNNSDAKSTELCDYVLQKLLKHVSLLATDRSFCFALILRLERVRHNAALPTHAYDKLLRRLIAILSPDSKADLFRDLYDPSRNPTGARALQRTPAHHLESHTRSVFNRLAVKPTEGDDTDISSTLRGDLMADGNELIIDAELLVLTNPVEFLSKLIRIPVDRNCSSSQPAIHQVLGNLTEYLRVSLTEINRNISLRQKGSYLSSNDEMLEQLTLVDLLLLSNILFKKSNLYLFDEIVESTAIDHGKLDDLLVVNITLTSVDLHNADQSITVINPFLDEMQQLAHRGLLISSASYLFSLCPNKIGPLFQKLAFQVRALAPAKHSVLLNLVYTLLSAVTQFITDHSSVDRAFFQSLTIFQQDFLICQLIDLYTNLFLAADCIGLTVDGSWCEVELRDCDCLLTALLAHLLSEYSQPTASPTVNVPDPCWKAKLVDVQTCLLSTRGLYGLRQWVLCCPLFSCASPSDRVCKDLAVSQLCTCNHQGRYAHRLGKLLDLRLLQSRLGLYVGAPMESTEATNELSPDSSLLGQPCPHLLHFVLLVSSCSTSSCQAILDALRVTDVMESGGGGSPPISTSCLLMTLLALLRQICLGQHPRCWSRVLTVVLHLFSKDLVMLVLPLATESSGEHVLPSAVSLYLYDWSGLRGTFDMFYLMTNLMRLWLLTNFSSLSDAYPKSDTSDTLPVFTEISLLCNTLSLATQNLLVTTIKLQGEEHAFRFRYLVRQLALSLLNSLLNLLSADCSHLGIPAAILAVVQRLHSTVLTAHGKLLNKI